MKKNLKDVTFLIPVRLDSIVRIENLMAVIANLRDNFDTNIMLLEAAPYRNSILESLYGNTIDYTFIEDDDPVFYRTYFLNRMIERVKTPVTAVWDADVILPADAIDNCTKAILSGRADIAYPYTTFWDTSAPLRKLFIKRGCETEILKRNLQRMSPLYEGPMFGGAFMASTSKYIESGMENEDFYGWGPEDSERYYRWKNLGYRIHREPGEIYHLTHPRDSNGTFRNRQQQERTWAGVLEAIDSVPGEILKKAK